MLIKRIDFKGDRIWRVYRNGEIIWSTSDLKYLESVKTGLQFIDIGALGISSSSLVYNLENKINFKEFYNFNSDEARNITNKHKIIITDSYNLASSNSKIREIYKSLLFSGMKRFNSNDSKLNFILKKIEINTL